MGLLARAMKQAVAATLYRTGLLGLWWRLRGRARRAGPLIVTYHRVLPPEAGLDHSQAGIVVSTASFERQLRLLSRLFAVVPLRDAAASAEPERCAVTFDDGWADNHAHALPVLRRLGIPATLFVTTGLIGTNRLFWPEELAFLLVAPARQRLDAAAFDGLDAPVHQALMQVASAGDAEVPAALDRLIESAKGLREEERAQMLALIAHQVGREASGLEPRLLDWPRVAEMHAAGVEIGAHGVTHAILTRVEPAQAVAEIAESRAAVARAIGRPAAAFAYPNGDASPELAQAVAAAGFELAVITDGAPIPGCPPQFALRRKNLAEGSSRGAAGFSAAVFACEVLGLFDALRALGSRRRR